MNDNANRPAIYLTAEDALFYARHFHQVPGARGWSQALMDANLPGWTLTALMATLRQHRLIGRDRSGAWAWRRHDVIGVAIDGPSALRDTGNLQHPAKDRYHPLVRVEYR